VKQGDRPIAGSRACWPYGICRWRTEGSGRRFARNWASCATRSTHRWRLVAADQRARRTRPAHRRNQAGQHLPPGARGAGAAPVAERNPGPLPAAAAQRIVREVMSACLALEQPLTIRLPRSGRHLFGIGGAQAFRRRADAAALAGHRRRVPRRRGRQCRLRRGADRELDRRCDRPLARPAAVLALADLRRDQPADPPQPDGAAHAGRRSRASIRTRSRWRSATSG
jgi:hypothetical protein